MIVLPMPHNQDELLGFCKEISHTVNTVMNHSVNARIGSTHCKVTVHNCFLHNDDGNEELAFVIEGEDASGMPVVWEEKLSWIKVREFGHHRGYYFSSPTQKALLLYV